jgi:hypothetical protein
MTAPAESIMPSLSHAASLPGRAGINYYMLPLSYSTSLPESPPTVQLGS